MGCPPSRRTRTTRPIPAGFATGSPPPRRPTTGDGSTLPSRALRSLDAKQDDRVAFAVSVLLILFDPIGTIRERTAIDGALEKRRRSATVWISWSDAVVHHFAVGYAPQGIDQEWLGEANRSEPEMGDAAAGDEVADARDWRAAGAHVAPAAGARPRCSRPSE